MGEPVNFTELRHYVHCKYMPFWFVFCRGILYHLKLICNVLLYFLSWDDFLYHIKSICGGLVYFLANKPDMPGNPAFPWQKPTTPSREVNKPMAKGREHLASDTRGLTNTTKKETRAIRK